jgi:hypothetical protein
VVSLIDWAITHHGEIRQYQASLDAPT